MTFTVRDFRDFISILDKEPQWRAELRRMILTDEMLDLPGAVQSLIEGQKKSDARIDALATQIQGLTVRMDQLTERMDQLAASMTQLTQRVDQLTVRMDEMKTQMDRRFTNVDRDLGSLKGFMLEQQYLQKSGNAFQRVIRQSRPIRGDALYRLLNKATQQNILTDKESYEIECADLVLHGLDLKTNTPLYCVIEISWGVGVDDIECAVKRANMLSKLGTPALPVVAGKWITPDGKQRASELNVSSILENRSYESESEYGS